MFHLMFFLAVAIGGGLLGIRLRLPAGAMIGTMAAVIIFNLTFRYMSVPQETSKVIQLLSGVLIGVKIKRKDLLALKEILVPAIVMIVGMLLLSLGVGFSIHRFSGLDLSTSLFASAPGGLTDMAIIAEDLGADGAKVAVLHLVRLLSIIGFFPVLIKSLCHRFAPGNGCCCSEEKNTGGGFKAVQEGEVPSSPKDKAWGRFLLTLSIGIAGGGLGIFSGIPAGAMVGSMMFVMAFNIVTSLGYVPDMTGDITRIAAGLFIGSQVSYDDILTLNEVVLPGIILFASLIFLNISFGFLMSKWFQMDLSTALFASAPGGLADMTLIADELGADSTKVAVLQMIRLVSIISILPMVLKYILLL